jgi:hypothetical protein
VLIASAAPPHGRRDHRRAGPIEGIDCIDPNSTRFGNFAESFFISIKQDNPRRVARASNLTPDRRQSPEFARCKIQSSRAREPCVCFRANHDGTMANAPRSFHVTALRSQGATQMTHKLMETQETVE